MWGQSKKTYNKGWEKPLIGQLELTYQIISLQFNSSLASAINLYSIWHPMDAAFQMLLHLVVLR